MSQSEQNNEYSSIEINEIEKMIEVASSNGYFSQSGNGVNLSDITLDDLYKYLRNPYGNINQIRNTSRYMTNKYGVVKETLRLFKSIPSLDYTISWSDYTNEKKIKTNEKKVQDFLRSINIKSFVREGLYQLAEQGSLIMCNRNNKYIQFIELDDVRIERQVNGRWLIEYDLKTIDNAKTKKDKESLINSLPSEITVAKYNQYKNKGEDYRYIELKDARILGIDTYRNYPHGLPYTIGAWNALLQKDLIDKVERSVANSLLRKILLLKAGYIDKENTKLVPKEVINAYFKNISNVLTKNNGTANKYGNKTSADDSGIGLISLLQGLSLEALDIKTDTFKKELYDKINNDIFLNLGVSQSMISGQGGSFSSAQLNSEKLFRYVFENLEKFEDFINECINKLLPKDLSCTFMFAKTTIFDKEKNSEQLKGLYLQTGASKYWLEAVTGLPYQEVLKQVEFERNILRTDEILNPPENFYNQSGNKTSDDKGGRPESENPTNESTNQTKSSGGNNNPKPSTQ